MTSLDLDMQHGPTLGLLSDTCLDGAAVSASPVGCTVAIHEPCPAFQLRLEDGLRGIEDAAELAVVACRMISDQIGAERAMLLCVEDDGRCTALSTMRQLQTVDHESVPFSLADFGVRSKMARGEHFCVADVRLDPRLASVSVQTRWAARDVIALAAMPVLVSGRLVAVLLVASPRPLVWQDSQLRMLRSSSLRVWAAFGRAKSLVALKRSEHDYRMAIELCSQTFYSATPDGSVAKYGKSFGQLRNLGHDQPGLDWRRTTHQEDLPRVEREAARCLRTGETYDVEYRTCVARERVRWVHVHAKPMREADGSILRWFGTITDISRRKRVEAALQASEERFERALAGARVGTWEWDLEADKFETSRGCASTFFGRPDGSIRCSRDVTALLHADDRAAIVTEMRHVRRRARPVGMPSIRRSSVSFCLTGRYAGWEVWAA